MKTSAKYSRPQRVWLFAAGMIACVTWGARAVGNSTASQPAFASFSSAPLCFEADAGQSGGSAQFIARGTQCSVLLAPDAAEIIVGKASNQAIPVRQKSTRTVRLQLVGANPAAKIFGRDRMTATANYFIGNDPTKWRTGVPLFSRVQVDDVYPGVQVVYYASQSAELEYDFLLQPGAQPAQIQFHVEGADNVQVDASGNLVLKFDGQEIRQHQPVVYQDANGTRRQIDGYYHLNENGTVGFALGEYDHNLPLVIDPVLEFLTYIGGRNSSTAWGIVLQTNNIPAIYVAGLTLSKNLLTPVSPTNMLTTNAIIFPVAFTNVMFPNGAVTNRVFTNYQGGTGAFGDAFVASYGTNGTLNFLSYLGGRRNDGALAIAADPTNGVWLTGFTDSLNFPISNGELSNSVLFSTLTGPTNNALGISPVDAFITHLSADGSTLLFSTYFGGDEIDEGFGIAVDGSGDVFVTGVTSSTNLPIGFTNLPFNAGSPPPGVPNVFQPTNNGYFDAFVTELSPDTTLGNNNYTNTFSTFFGGTNVDYALSIALDSSNDVWITGLTYSTNFVTTNISVLTSTFLAQMANGTANSVDVETNHLFADLNSQTNAPHHNTSGRSDAFVAEFSPFGTNLLFSTLLGGTNDDIGVQIAVNQTSNNVYVTGYTLSRDFPTNVATGLTFVDEANNLGVTNSGFPHITTNVFVGAATNFISHAFVTELVPTNSNGTNFYIIGSSTSLGGNSADRGTGIGLDAAGNVYVIGSAASTNFFVNDVVILTNTTLNINGNSNTNHRGIITNYTGLGILTNNFTYVNLTSTNSTGKLRPNSLNTNDVFIAVLTPDLSDYRWSIILGGPGDNEALGMAVDPSGSAVYFVGSTTSRTNFATTNVVQRIFSHGARQQAFAGKISGLETPPGDQ